MRLPGSLFAIAGALAAAAPLLDCQCLVPVRDCGPLNCRGCCDPDGLCQAGADNLACGNSGDVCADCTRRAKVCGLGACVPPSAAPDGGRADGGCRNAPCLVGQRECTGATTFRECRIGADACPAWATGSCGTRSCSNGWCGGGSDGGCSSSCDYDGQKACLDPTTFGVCTTESSGCRQWKVGGCAPGQVCAGGACAGADAGCPNACSFPGQRACLAPNQWAVCYLDALGCLSWRTLVCPSGQVCSSIGCVATDGGSVADAGCVNSCSPQGASSCTGPSTLTVCANTPSGCLAWQQFVCYAGAVCAAGACVAADAGSTLGDGGSTLNANIGIACATDAECGPDGQCLTYWPSGYCTTVCSSSRTCPSASTCQTAPFASTGACLANCPNPWGGQSTCRQDYLCYGAWPDGGGQCAPDCRQLAAGCGLWICNRSTGYCR